MLIYPHKLTLSKHVQGLFILLLFTGPFFFLVGEGSPFNFFFNIGNCLDWNKRCSVFYNSTMDHDKFFHKLQYSLKTSLFQVFNTKTFFLVGVKWLMCTTQRFLAARSSQKYNIPQNPLQQPTIQQKVDNDDTHIESKYSWFCKCSDWP